MDSYTIGRENFGMEKEFIVEVVQNCPNPACRYYKTQLDLSQHSKQSNYINSPNSGWKLYSWLLHFQLLKQLYSVFFLLRREHNNG